MNASFNLISKQHTQALSMPAVYLSAIEFNNDRTPEGKGPGDQYS